MTTSPDTPGRERALRDWLRPRFGEVDLLPASADASFRRYFRIRRDGESFIVMDAPPEQEDSRRFVDIAGRLAACGVHVPAVLASDAERGFLLLSDLGVTDYLHALNGDNADRLFADAIDALVRMQAGADGGGLPAYDRELLWRELRLFPDWYLCRHLQVELDPGEAAALEAVYERLIERALGQGRVFVHRDYMPRNLMVADPNPGVLDFQDAVIGPVSYDAICLFKDAFVSWPQNRVERWLGEYWREARDRGLPVPADRDSFRIDLDWMGLQRHLKVLGIFARIRYRDGKPQYLDDAPRFVGYLLEVLPSYPELSPLQRLLERHVLPVAGEPVG